MPLSIGMLFIYTFTSKSNWCIVMQQFAIRVVLFLKVGSYPNNEN